MAFIDFPAICENLLASLIATRLPMFDTCLPSTFLNIPDISIDEAVAPIVNPPCCAISIIVATFQKSLSFPDSLNIWFGLKLVFLRSSCTAVFQEPVVITLLPHLVQGLLATLCHQLDQPLTPSTGV